jgi:hypothetical protein
MRFAIEPIGFPVTKMRKGKWNHTKIFSDYQKMEDFTREWFEESLEYDKDFFRRGVVTCDELQEMLADTEEVSPVGVLKNRITADLKEIWVCHKGFFLVREFA